MCPVYVYKCDTCGVEKDFQLSVCERDMFIGQTCFNDNCNGSIYRELGSTSFRLSEKGNHGWASNGYADNLLGNDPSFRK